MVDTALQRAAQEASDQKQLVLRQQAMVLSLKSEGSPRLEREMEVLEALRNELMVKEGRLERLIYNA